MISPLITFERVGIDHITTIVIGERTLWTRAGEPLCGRVPKLSINVEGILSRGHGNFEKQNKVLGPSIVIINYCIITNAYYN